MSIAAATNLAKSGSRLIPGLGALVLVGSFLAVGSSALSGQNIGGVTDFIGGVVDVGSGEDYYEDGGTETGTVSGAIGNLAGSGITAGALIAMKTNPALRKFAPILFAWQGAQLASEVLSSDGDSIKDPLDMADNVLSMWMLGRTAGIGQGLRAAAALVKKKGILTKAVKEITDVEGIAKLTITEARAIGKLKELRTIRKLANTDKALVEMAKPQVGIVKSGTDIIKQAWAA